MLASLAAQAERAVRAGIPRQRVILDPGIGFGKTAEHNLALLGALDRLVALGFPTLVGTSRKSTLGKLTGRGVGARAFATAATVALAVAAGIDIVRVHDVAEMRDVTAVADAIVRGWRPRRLERARMRGTPSFCGTSARTEGTARTRANAITCKPFDIDLGLELDLGPARASDGLEETLDYAAIHARVVALVGERSFVLLERLGDAILTELMADARIGAAAVTIAKPRLMAGATPAVRVVARR